MIASMWDLAERYRYRYLFMSDQAANIDAEHQAIFEACRARSPQMLQDAIVNHMQRTLHAVKAYYYSQQRNADGKS